MQAIFCIVVTEDVSALSIYGKGIRIVHSLIVLSCKDVSRQDDGITKKD